jgi:hypothetical protein
MAITKCLISAHAVARAANGGRAAEQREELVPLHAGHGLPPAQE